MAGDSVSTRGKTVVLSSLPLQILLYLNGWYFALFWIGELLLFIYKATLLPYPGANFAAEAVILIFMAGIEYVRLFLGKKGNLTEKIIHLGVSLGIGLATLFFGLYLFLWQTYVLRIELILVAIEMAFLFFEAIFGLIAIITFARAESFR
ncbi:transmembrane protein 216-like [Patiria miniata]|uniref:Transmembrane protein 216 n=1 Tax=Patiria miniata TaxID=46514 RepID=A0A913ZB48_PATMI|nr:transmembrane protein 216-like [Patiria miniata]XP_038049007.1 transmembrane protein 216-like [Patiria miniata]